MKKRQGWIHVNLTTIYSQTIEFLQKSFIAQIYNLIILLQSVIKFAI